MFNPTTCECTSVSVLMCCVHALVHMCMYIFLCLGVVCVCVCVHACIPAYVCVLCICGAINAHAVKHF